MKENSHSGLRRRTGMGNAVVCKRAVLQIGAGDPAAGGGNGVTTDRQVIDRIITGRHFAGGLAAVQKHTPGLVHLRCLTNGDGIVSNAATAVRIALTQHLAAAVGEHIGHAAVFAHIICHAPTAVGDGVLLDHCVHIIGAHNSRALQAPKGVATNGNALLIPPGKGVAGAYPADQVLKRAVLYGDLLVHRAVIGRKVGEVPIFL